jgi:hypothetical protein
VLPGSLLPLGLAVWEALLFQAMYWVGLPECDEAFAMDQAA